MGIRRWVRRDLPVEALSEPGRTVKTEVTLPATPAEVPAAQPATDWEALRAQVAACEKCALHASRTQTVFGTGDRNADLLIIGSHSKRGPLDVGLGSTASALLRDLETTVMMVRPTEAERRRAQELAIPRYPWVFPYG